MSNIGGGTFETNLMKCYCFMGMKDEAEKMVAKLKEAGATAVIE